MVKVHLLDSGRELEAYRERIEETVERTVSRVEAALPLRDVDIAIMRNPWAVIPSTGIGGTAPTAHTILISLEPNTAGFSEHLERELSAILAHELHHATRYHKDRKSVV